MKSYVGLRGTSSAQDKLFACPADVYYYPYFVSERPNTATCVEESWCAQSNSDYSSYVFNAGNLLPAGRGTGRLPWPGIAGMTLSSIKHPSRTVLVAEAPAVIPFSWHQPRKLLFWVMQSGGCSPSTFFNNSMNMVSFVDGHVSYIKNILSNPHKFRGLVRICLQPARRLRLSMERRLISQNHNPPPKSPEPTPVGAGRSAVAAHVASRRWLSILSYE